MSSQSPQCAQESRDLKKADERRKQLNRRAQKAFRERRSEHMAQLEITLEQMKKDLHCSQQAQSRAKDELLMVKYKNSLLERLLLEHGIDVHRELANPQAMKNCRDRHSSDARARRSHKKRRVEEQRPKNAGGRILDHAEYTTQAKHSPVSTKTLHSHTTTVAMSGADMRDLISTFSDPEPAAQLHQQTRASSSDTRSPIEQLDPSRSLYDYNCPAPFQTRIPDEVENSPMTASPESTRTPPDISQATFVYPDPAGGEKVNKVAFASDATFHAADLLMLEGLGSDPFGLDDIMNFPCQF